MDNHQKLTEIDKDGKISDFWDTKATVKQYFDFFCEWQVMIM
jgi:hypothetical protein